MRGIGRKRRQRQGVKIRTFGHTLFVIGKKRNRIHADYRSRQEAEIHPDGFYYFLEAQPISPERPSTRIFIWAQDISSPLKFPLAS